MNDSVTEEITGCCICGQETENAYNLPFLDLYGMRQYEYTQRINICPRCGFIFTYAKKRHFVLWQTHNPI